MAYGYYRPITVDNTQVSGSSNISNFIFTIKSTVAEWKTVANGGKIQNTASGGASGSMTVPADLAFYDDTSATTKYDHQIVSYNASTGAIVARVKIPTLSYNSDTTIYAHYGDSGVTTSQENITGVWSGYLGSWDLNRDPSGSAPQIYDNTSEGNNGTSYGTMTSGDLVSGEVDQAIDFDGSDDGIDFGDHTSFDGETQFTIRAIINPDSIPSGATEWAILRKWWAGGATVSYGFYGSDMRLLAKDSSNRIINASGGSYTAVATWVALRANYAISSNNIDFIKNGSTYNTQSSAALSGGLTNSTGAMGIGSRILGDDAGDGTDFHFDGLIEHVSWQQGLPNDDILTTEYNNQSDPANFYTVGSEVSVGGGSSASPSISPSISNSPSPSISPSISSSPSPSLSPSISPSISSSPSPSASLSPSLSPSISSSPSPSASLSPSLSPSISSSPSPSLSPSTPPVISGSTTWGHDTGVTEDNTRDFTGNWTGTGEIQGTGDAEKIVLNASEYMESEVVDTGAVQVTLLQNQYQAADNVTIKYRTGNSVANCEAAALSTYTAPFTSSGYVQIRLESTL